MKIYIVGKGGERLDQCVESEVEEHILFTCDSGKSKYELVLSITTDGYRLIHKTDKYKIPLGTRAVILDDRDGGVKFLYSKDVTPKVPVARTTVYENLMLSVTGKGEPCADVVAGSMLAWDKVGFGLRIGGTNTGIEFALATTLDSGVIFGQFKVVADLSLLGMTTYSKSSDSKKYSQFGFPGRDYLSYKISAFYVLDDVDAVSVGIGYGHYSYSDDHIPSSDRFFIGFNFFQNNRTTTQLEPNQ